MKQIFETMLSGRKLTAETGSLAEFANGSVLVRYGDTVILSTATAADHREGVDFFPLSVDYEEKMYAVGKIPGGFLRREGRPSEQAILTARLIDRPLRPLFPSDLRSDVNINNLVLCVDHDNSPEIASMIGSSIALSISDIPWGGPVAGVQVAIYNGEIIVNPNQEQRENSSLQLTVAGTKEKICMIEAGADEIEESVMLEAISKAHEVISEVCDFIQSIKDKVGKPKFEYKSFALPEKMKQICQRYFYDKMRVAVLEADKATRDANVAELKNELSRIEEVQLDEELHNLVGQAIDYLEKQVVREYLFKEHKRVDGRALDEIRPLSAEIDILPRTHGSALFSRGKTQVLSICTLGTLSNVQKLDGVDAAEQKRYMHHYNFPGYSVGEAKPNRSPGRREIGHGALAERAIIPVLPDEEDFPYAIRCVSEITMSNGSTSQGSVCASTLSLMAAGVPIKRPVAGISSGLITNPENPDDYLVFMDIQGIEDFFGDMDFKVAGTEKGITAIQVDIKVDGLSLDIIRDAFELTRKGRMQILNDVMLPTISEPREEISPYAPKITQIDIPADKIREVIGSGGKVIKRITEETACEIDIEEDGPIGHVYIASPDCEKAEKALSIIRLIVSDPEEGTVLEGEVTRIMAFGAFVEYAPGKEGLVHISKISQNRINRVEDVLSVGDKVKVYVSEIDNLGRVNLSMREIGPNGELIKTDFSGDSSRKRDRFSSSYDSSDSHYDSRDSRDSYNSYDRGDRKKRSGFSPRGRDDSGYNRKGGYNQRSSRDYNRPYRDGSYKDKNNGDRDYRASRPPRSSDRYDRQDSRDKLPDDVTVNTWEF